MNRDRPVGASTDRRARLDRRSAVGHRRDGRDSTRIDGTGVDGTRVNGTRIERLEAKRWRPGRTERP